MTLRKKRSAYAYVPMITRLRTWPGRAIASSWAIAPPIDKPTTCARPMPSASISAAVSAAKSGTVLAGGVDERPTPRLSTTVTRQRSLRADLVDPARALVGEAGDEDDVVALPRLQVVQVDAIYVFDGHGAILNRFTPLARGHASQRCVEIGQARVDDSGAAREGIAGGTSTSVPTADRSDPRAATAPLTRSAVSASGAAASRR